MVWKSTNLSIEGPPVDSACQSTNQAMKSKELSVDLWDRIVSRHRSGEGYRKMSAALKVQMSTVASIIRKSEKFGTIRARFGTLAKLGDRRRRALVREMIKNPIVTLTELQHCSMKREPSRRTTISAALTDRDHSSVKGTWQPTWSLPKDTWRTLRPWGKTFSGLMKQRL